MTISNEFELGDIVYLKTDEKQLERMVTAFYVSPIGLRYQLTQGTVSDYFHAIEISREKSFLSNKKIGFGNAN